MNPQIQVQFTASILRRCSQAGFIQRDVSRIPLGLPYPVLYDLEIATILGLDSKTCLSFLKAIA